MMEHHGNTFIRSDRADSGSIREGEKTVIIVGMVRPFEGDSRGADIWGMNWTFLNQSNLARIYFVDPLEKLEICNYKDRTDKTYVEHLNSLGVPVVCSQVYPQIPASEEYPLNEVLRLTGCKYFTSSVSYMIADAILKDYQHIILHALLPSYKHLDYVDQKACIDFWIGFAMGRGIRVSVSSDSYLAKPMPWQSPLYGFQYRSREEEREQRMALVGA